MAFAVVALVVVAKIVAITIVGMLNFPRAVWC